MLLAQTLRDTASGPDWVLWVIMIIFLIITILGLSGKGANLIAGFNSMSKEEKEEYNEKRLSHVLGIGMGIITLIILIMTIFIDILPAAFSYIFLAVVIVDALVMLILFGTYCKKK